VACHAGLYFEELEPGAVIDHATRRTVTKMDNVLFSSLTLNLAPLHLDAEYYAKEYHIERLWREVRLLRLAPISQEMVLDFVSTSVLGLPGSY
jgi:acyl dehydratase